MGSNPLFIQRWQRAAVLALALAGASAATLAETVARYGISMADIPLTTGQPDRGAGAYQFTGHTIYDPLIAWEANVGNRPGKLVPGLATEWKADPKDQKVWRFSLRKGVKFHDGSEFKADAVIWNLEKVLNDKSPQFDAKQSAQVRPRIPSIASFRKIDDFTVEITTKDVDALFPYQLPWLLIGSPTQWEKLGRDWSKVATAPSGTGPFRLEKLVARERAELVKNVAYWDKTRIPKTDRIVLLPIPDALTRANALLNGQVDIIETPPPDVLPQLRAQGFKLVQNVTPHVWPYHFSTQPGSPWTDVRVRKAMNLAIDRAAIVKLLNGQASVAKGQLDPTSPWFAPSGGGQMVAIAMNEVIQENLRAVGVNVNYDVRDFTAMITMLRNGAKVAQADGINIAMTMQDPGSGIVSSYRSIFAPPAGGNWGFYNNPAFDDAWKAAMLEFETDRQEAAMAKVNEILTEDAAAIVVVHDTSPRALSPKLKGFVQARNWYQDFTTIEVMP